jgi:hypothetical protein
MNERIASFLSGHLAGSSIHPRPSWAGDHSDRIRTRREQFGEGPDRAKSLKNKANNTAGGDRRGRGE